MKEYVYETFHYQHGLVMRGNNKQRYRDIINRYAKDGYRSMWDTSRQNSGRMA